MLLDWESWFSVVWDVLQTDDEACLGLIRSAGGRGAAAVALVEGDANAADALAYARTLCELGLLAEAREILAEVLRAAFGWIARQPAVEGSWISA
jgi:hypothetical protein